MLSTSSIHPSDLCKILRACQANPFSLGIEGSVWEAAFHHLHGLPVPNLTSHRPNKRLFDAVDPKTGTGWSLKTIQMPQIRPRAPFSVVVKRITLTADQKAWTPQQKGEALLRDWLQKVSEDQTSQGILYPKMGILLKNTDQTKFSCLECPLYLPSQNDVFWSFHGRENLLGSLIDGTPKYRWYPNGKQFFEYFTIPHDIDIVSVSQVRLTPVQFVSKMLSTP